MKLSWRDIVTAALAVLGGAVVYAKFYDYTWALIGSWRSAAMILAVVGILMFTFSGFNFANRSILNVGEMVFGVAALVLAAIGSIVVSKPVFYSLAAVLAATWLVDIARHARHSMMSEEDSAVFHHHAPVH